MLNSEENIKEQRSGEYSLTVLLDHDQGFRTQTAKSLYRSRVKSKEYKIRENSLSKLLNSGCKTDNNSRKNSLRVLIDLWRRTKKIKIVYRSRKNSLRVRVKEMYNISSYLYKYL